MDTATFGAGRFWGTPEQAAQARAKVDAPTKAEHFRRPIVTVIEPFRNFCRAEEYHQRNFKKNGLPSYHVTLLD